MPRQDGVNTDVLRLGKCKELVETAYKYVLAELNEPFLESDDLIQLNKKDSTF